MCPVCLATVGLVVAGAVSTGGLAALAVKVSRRKNAAAEIVPDLNNIEDLGTDNSRATSVRPGV
jgi:hypothetical protein